MLKHNAESWEPTKHNGFRRTGVAQNGRAPRRFRGGRYFESAPRYHVKFNEKLGLPECPYVIRWRIETPVGSIRLHHWLKPDDDRAFHDHPWWFLTLVLRGGYTDHSPDGEQPVNAGSIHCRPALHRHTVVPYPGGAWTLILTGPKSRAWGFWLDGKFRKANKWFATFGHHPCD